MKKFISILMALFLAGCHSSQETNEIDARNKMMESADQKCRLLQRGAERDNCFSEAYFRAVKKYPWRGTKNYSVMHYSELSKAEAQEVIANLKMGYDQAGDDIRGDQEGRAGTIGKFAYVNEAWWIREHILGDERIPGLPW